MKREQKEDKEINQPVSKLFLRKMKCHFSRVGFTFSGGQLDVLGYDRKNRCFHVSEGKRSSNVASLGHAIGQLIAYMTMIQEDGYDFLNRVSKGERLELSDFSIFFEKKSIMICFYIALPRENTNKLLNTAKMILNNLGDLGSSIGIIFASKSITECVISPHPIEIKISRNYNSQSFIQEIQRVMFEMPEFKGLEVSRTDNKIVQFKEKDGNPFLHYEICIRRFKKTDKSIPIEIGFHLEFAKAHLADKTTVKRKNKLVNAMRNASKKISDKGFIFESKWGNQWARIYFIYQTESLGLNDNCMEEVINRLKILIKETKPLFDRINWGRLKKKEI